MQSGEECSSSGVYLSWVSMLLDTSKMITTVNIRKSAPGFNCFICHIIMKRIRLYGYAMHVIRHLAILPT